LNPIKTKPGARQGASAENQTDVWEAFVERLDRLAFYKERKTFDYGKRK